MFVKKNDSCRFFFNPWGLDHNRKSILSCRQSGEGICYKFVFPSGN